MFDNNELALPDECPECGLSFTAPCFHYHDGGKTYPLRLQLYGGLVYNGFLVVPRYFSWGGDPSQLCPGPFFPPVKCIRCKKVLYDAEGNCLVEGLSATPAKPAIDTIITTGEAEVK